MPLRITTPSAGTGVGSVNGHTGAVVLAASDVGADASGAAAAAIAASAAIQPLPALGSRITAVGHSWLTGGGDTHIDRQFITELAGMLRADLRDLAVGGALAALDSSWKGNPSSFGGWAWVRQMVQSYRTAAPYTPAVFLPLVVQGQNDLVQHHADSGSPRGIFKHAMRSTMSWLCQARVFEETDASIVFSGSWAARVPSTVRNSGSGYRPALANGATFTVTLPADFEGGSVGIDLIAFPAGDGQITWSGTASQLPATLSLSGLAYATGGAGAARDGSNGIVARVTGLTAADAGKTIIGTYGSGAGTAVSTPSAPGAITTTGTAGSTTYSYARVYRYFNGETVLSSLSSIATGNATLTGSNFNNIPAGAAWPAGVEAELIVRTVGGTPGVVATLTTGPAVVTDKIPVAPGGAYTPNASNPLVGGFAFDAWHIEANAPAAHGLIANIATFPAAALASQGVTAPDFTNYNSDIAALVAEFAPNQWKLVDIDATMGGNAAYWNGTHPNDRGHALIAASFYSAFQWLASNMAASDIATQSRVMRRPVSRQTVLLQDSGTWQGFGTNYTLSASWADVDATNLYITMDAQPGDDIEFILSGMWMSGTGAGSLDMAIVDSGGTVIRYASATPAFPTTPGALGWPAWYQGSTSGAVITALTGSCLITVQPSDLQVINTVPGILFARLRGISATSRGIYGGGNASPPLMFQARNLGPRNTPGINAS